ncbi:glycoside hydrolase [Desulfonema ishimotonii]|uniref:Glycoside hydrolase n=1 Tax=Desulfonema ishimotonii TaxID=45657 RepID=A0A401FT59_9BACT|nr:NlpC/P60 family protein [Desulfonema ishimotonii]GBC60151.1 glycoside hydrolase [Desulfonema ishimotonii]
MKNGNKHRPDQSSDQRRHVPEPLPQCCPQKKNTDISLLQEIAPDLFPVLRSGKTDFAFGPKFGPNDASAAFYEEYSKRLGIKLDGTENRQLLLAIDDWLRTPYRFGGCSKRGIDCSCLVKTIYEDVYGIELTRTTRTIYKNIRYRNLIPVRDKKALREGDIICFRMRGRRVSHVGIYIKDNKFLHASLSKGVTIADLNKKYFKRRFVTGGRPDEAGMPGTSLSKLESP